MSEYYDEAKAECSICKHLWILGSDKEISDNLYKAWCDVAMIEHEKYHEEWEKNK